MTKEGTFLRTTAGLAFRGIITKFNFYENKQDGITIVPILRSTLQPIKILGTVDITKKEYNDIDPYDERCEWEQAADYFR